MSENQEDLAAICSVVFFVILLVVMLLPRSPSNVVEPITNPCSTGQIAPAKGFYHQPEDSLH